MCLVADGHGGRRYIRSADGSRIAVKIGIISSLAVLNGCIDSCIKNRDREKTSENLKLVCSKIVNSWRLHGKEGIVAHYKKTPLSPEEEKICREEFKNFPLTEDDIYTLYGTTLLIGGYVEKYGFWYAIQIGDGKCIAIREDGSIFYPIQDDEKLAFGVTTSLCGKNAISDFRYAFGYDRLSGIAVMSDGLTDSFEKDKLPDFILNIQKNMFADERKTKEELRSFLPRLSEMGSGDDISIASIFMKN